ncbi:hypothetical protein Tco_1325555 [Tanacetum coccineum]|uniref:Uncharacterized protein n=1 Tax=Tanacetum coccineum TaxID=301880 RepID=A0ABQ5GHR1_9ASTR
MDFRSFMLGGVDGELNFLHAEGVSEGQNSPFAKSVNNNAPMIYATPLSSVYPLNVVKNVADSDDPSYGEDEQTLIGLSLSPHPEASKKFKLLGKRKVAFGVLGKALPLKVQKVPARANKVAGEAFTALDVESDSNIHDCHWVVAHVISPSWKQHLREIRIEQLCDIHDRAYMSQAVLDNVLNSKTRELISALHKAKTSYDAIRAREIDKDRAYAELEKKCNEALQDLDKNPLVFDMHAEIKDLQGQVDGLHSEYSRLILEEKKIAIKLIRSDDLGVLVAKLVRSSIIYGRCQAFEEVAAMEEPIVLEKMSGYRTSSKEEYDQAGNALANASYPFLAEYVANPYASLEQLLSKKPPLLRLTFFRSRSKPLSLKVK